MKKLSFQNTTKRMTIVQEKYMKTQSSKTMMRGFTRIYNKSVSCKVIIK